MLPKWLLSSVPRVGVLILIVYVAWLGWVNLGPRKPEIGPVRKDVADTAIPLIVEDLRQGRGDVHSVALLHFTNDPTDYFTDSLRAIIEQRGVFDLRDRTVIEKARNILNLRHPAYLSVETAANAGKRLGVQTVLYGTLNTFESYPGGAKIDADINLVTVTTGVVVFSKNFTRDTSVNLLSAPAIEEKVATVPWFQRTLGWILVVLLLPVFTISFVRAMVRKESNKANAFVLGVYTLADAVMAYLLVGAALDSVLPVALFILAVVIAFLYNVQIMSFALRLEEV